MLDRPGKKKSAIVTNSVIKRSRANPKSNSFHFDYSPRPRNRLPKTWHAKETVHIREKCNR